MVLPIVCQEKNDILKKFLKKLKPNHKRFFIQQSMPD
jgi:hypothetical protein